MRVRTLDGVVVDVGGDDDVSGPPELINLRSEVVIAATTGVAMTRAAAIAGLTQAQFEKLFGRSMGKGAGRYRQAQRLRVAGQMVQDEVVRGSLAIARASYRALLAVARYRDPEAQLAAYARHVTATTIKAGMGKVSRP